MSANSVCIDSMGEKSLPTWFSRWFMSTNHKDIGIFYFIFGAFCGVVGATLSLVIRMQLVCSEGSVFFGNWQLYNFSLTAHGLIMLFYLVMPIIYYVFGNFFIPLLLGAPDIAFPRMNMNNLSFWLMPLIFLLFLSFVIQAGYLECAYLPILFYRYHAIFYILVLYLKLVYPAFFELLSLRIFNRLKSLQLFLKYLFYCFCGAYLFMRIDLWAVRIYKFFKSLPPYVAKSGLFERLCFFFRSPLFLSLRSIFSYCMHNILLCSLVSVWGLFVGLVFFYVKFLMRIILNQVRQVFFVFLKNPKLVLLLLGSCFFSWSNPALCMFKGMNEKQIEAQLLQQRDLANFVVGNSLPPGEGFDMYAVPQRVNEVPPGLPVTVHSLNKDLELITGHPFGLTFPGHARYSTSYRKNLARTLLPVGRSEYDVETQEIKLLAAEIRSDNLIPNYHLFQGNVKALAFFSFTRAAANVVSDVLSNSSKTSNSKTSSRVSQALGVVAKWSESEKNV
jgi:hypothetical protein